MHVKLTPTWCPCCLLLRRNSFLNTRKLHKNNEHILENQATRRDVPFLLLWNLKWSISISKRRNVHADVALRTRAPIPEHSFFSSPVFTCSHFTTWIYWESRKSEWVSESERKEMAKLIRMPPLTSINFRIVTSNTSIYCVGVSLGQTLPNALPS